MFYSLRIVQETPEDKARRLQAQRLHKEDRRAKLERTRYGGARNDVQLANIFREFGIDFLNTPRDQVFSLAPKLLEGKRPDNLSKEARDFLIENYGADARTDSEGRTVLHFPQIQKGEPMKLYTELAEKTGQTRKVVRTIYEALVEKIHSTLKTERVIRLPEIGRLKVAFRPAKEKRKGMNPFTGKEQWFKARPASNRLRFSPAKSLKVFVVNKIEVVAPKKKKKRGKK